MISAGFIAALQRRGADTMTRPGRQGLHAPKHRGTCFALPNQGSEAGFNCLDPRTVGLILTAT